MCIRDSICTVGIVSLKTNAIITHHPAVARKPHDPTAVLTTTVNRTHRHSFFHAVLTDVGRDILRMQHDRLYHQEQYEKRFAQETISLQQDTKKSRVHYYDPIFKDIVKANIIAYTLFCIVLCSYKTLRIASRCVGVNGRVEPGLVRP